MMETKHTPGPWEKTLRGGRYRIYALHGNKPIAYITCGIPENAHLIAAAPKLLEACQETIKAIRGYERRTGSKQLVSFVRMVEEAVAEALGKGGD